MKTVTLLTAVFVIIAMTGCDKPTTSGDTNGQASQKAAIDDLTSRCIGEALSRGYQNGQCAYGFINACVTTQSRSEMDKAHATDRMLGMASGRGCPNMDATYVERFNTAARGRDRF